MRTTSPRLPKPTGKRLTKPGQAGPFAVTDQEALRLEQVYSRGLGPYFLTGTNHQAVVRGRAPRHRGVWLGRVVKPSDGGVVIEPSAANRAAPLKPGTDWSSTRAIGEARRNRKKAAACLRS